MISRNASSYVSHEHICLNLKTTVSCTCWTRIGRQYHVHGIFELYNSYYLTVQLHRDKLKNWERLMRPSANDSDKLIPVVFANEMATDSMHSVYYSSRVRTVCVKTIAYAVFTAGCRVIVVLYVVLCCSPLWRISPGK